MEDNEGLNFDKNSGLIPVVVQDYITGEVLMLAYMNKESYELTLKTGYMHFFSRKRNKIWKKGETSGNIQEVVSLYYDCDGDTILAKVKQKGPACHTGNKTCFFNEIIKKENLVGFEILKDLMVVINKRKNEKKEGSYTCYLFEKGLDKILKKVGEEASEVIIAAKNGSKSEITYEVADLIYHLSVMLSYFDMDWEDILRELKERK
ncbi:bifunctional phosphoribosyl-AMP cyclohydrolase/phosphoribosyl-ATP diphosphatase HisIE [Thermovenabulum gondwanense]|uniref:Histidine biosynthesis bifunctional protein HisIE n=1 Tax=Thermovenabulum gondwanense TaxID=520767 RepID=A0A162M6S1_9FIRM|nr:bifunctional phosphoribosyl-AMP cyclohydrolase/phosphoribosyl-ATP diphosphatase HisIE [Thermovenabulum gondwanense]KYO64333.1 Phosphoribosyl-AMP cyclohydrolase [Thermovenabulum gondwanense]